MNNPQAIQQFMLNMAKFAADNNNSLINAEAKQTEKEALLLKQRTMVCPRNRTVPPQEYKKILDTGYGDASILDSLLCSNIASLSVPKDNGPGKTYKVRSLIDNLSRIGGESAEGYAMLASLRSLDPRYQDGKNLFVVKTPRKPSKDSYREQTHEYFIGVFGTNTLRNHIPNFSYVMGSFDCSPPFLNDREVVTFCQNDTPSHQVRYLLYENIEQSKTLFDYLSDCTLQQFLHVYVQISLAIAQAAEKIGFTHYDLHAGNVMIRRLDQPIQIKYSVGGQDYYMVTDRLACIIDFGRCHITYNGEHYGYYFYQAGIFPNVTFPLKDMFKLLCFSLGEALGGIVGSGRYKTLADDQIVAMTNRTVFNGAKFLLSYFDTNYPENRTASYLDETRLSYYELPNNDRYVKDSPVSLVKKIMAKYPDYQLVSVGRPVNTTTPLYGCANNNVCLTLETALRNYTTDEEALIKDFYVFTELMQRSSGAKRKELTEKGLPYLVDHIKQVYNDALQHHTKYLEWKKELVPVAIFSADGSRLDLVNLEAYRDYVVTVSGMAEEMTTLLDLQSLFSQYLSWFTLKDDDKNREAKRFYQEKFASMVVDKSLVNQNIQSLTREAQRVAGLTQRAKADIRASVKNRRLVDWLFTSLPDFLPSIDPVS